MERPRGSSNLDSIIIRNLSDTYPINDTKLFKYLWTLRANRTVYHLKWSLKSYAFQYKCGICDAICV